MKEKTKYAENARKASKAYYDRNKQKKLDKKTAELITGIHEAMNELEFEFEYMKDWVKTLAALKKISGFLKPSDRLC